MQKLLHCFTTKSKLIKLTKLQNNLFYYVTISNDIKIFSSPQSKTIKNLQNKNFNSISDIESISLDAKFVAFAIGKKINIISIETNSIINTIEIDEEVTAMSFDISNAYLFVGTSTGEVYQYRYDNKLKLSVLHRFFKSRYNFTNIVVSNYTKLLSADEYGAISVIDIYTYRSQEFNLNARLKATAICFLDEENIVIGDARGYLSFISLKKNKIVKSLLTPFYEIHQIITTPNKKYILLNSNNYYITLINIKTKKISILKYLIFEYKIVSIAINNSGLLYISLSNNHIYNINIYDTQELNSLIEKNNINEAYNLIKINPIFENSIEYNFLEKKYRLAYKEATLGLIGKDKTAIIKMKSIYRDVISKKEEIENLDKAFKEYKHLQDLFLEKKYAICYALIDKYPPLKSTPEYRKLEERYKSSLLAAQHQMSIDRQDLARTILSDYIIIKSKRPIIKPLLENNNEFLAHQGINKTKAKLDTNTLLFHQAYNHNEFKRCYEILDENSTLNDLELSKLLNKHYQNIISKCDEFALSGDIQSVQNELGDLLKISTRKEKIGSLLKVSFQAKIKILVDKKLYREAENMIYSYMDIFGIDFGLSPLMKEFETITSISLAISEQHLIKKDANAWYYNDFFNS